MILSRKLKSYSKLWTTGIDDINNRKNRKIRIIEKQSQRKLFLILIKLTMNRIVQNITEQNRTEQNRTEQNRTEQNRTEQNRNRTEQNRTEH